MSWTRLYLSSAGRDLEALAQEEQFFQVARIERCGVGRNHCQQRFDEMAHGDHGFAEFVVGFRVDAGVFGDGAAGFGVVVDAPEVFSLEHGSESAVERKDFQAVARQIEIANDFRAEERNYVRTNGKLEAGENFFGYCCAAQDITLFEDENLFACAGEIGRVDQAIVAAADYDYVVARGHG